VAHPFDDQLSPVDMTTQALQIGQVGQAFVHFEILGIAEGALRAQPSSFFEVLFQVKVLILDVQGGTAPSCITRVRNGPGMARIS
jgi:hypothetical protein